MNKFKTNSPYWTSHKGVDYFHIDFTKTDNDEKVIDMVKKSVDMTINNPDNSIRALLIVTGIKTTPAAMRIMKKRGKKIQPKMYKSAIVGSVGILSVLLRIYVSYTGSKLRFFTTKEAAIHYITSE